MDCLRRKIHLRIAVHQGVEIDCCPKCRSIWLATENRRSSVGVLPQALK